MERNQNSKIEIVSQFLSLFHFHHRLNVLLAGMTPFYFHLVNVCLHCMVTALLMHTCEQCVFDDSNLSFLTALLFSVHPIHTEAVSLHTFDHLLFLAIDFIQYVFRNKCFHLVVIL